MQRIALISDVHANLHALHAVLDAIDAEKVDQILCCGDVVGYGPRPRECVRLLRERGIPTVMGNHDFYTVQACQVPGFLPEGPKTRENMVWAGIRHAAESLEEEDVAWLAALPPALELPGALIAHAALHDFEEWPYLVDEEEAEPTLRILEERGGWIGFFGHSHQQEWFTLPETRRLKRLPNDGWQRPATTPCAVVVGSVGQPRTGDPRAAWTLWHRDTHRFFFRRTAYPVHQTMQEIADRGLPRRSALRLSTGN
jgi:predicted phosphodiesterase